MRTRLSPLAFLSVVLVLAALPVRAQDESEDEVFFVVEQEPELIGGIEALQRNVEYPEMARRAGIEGTVFVQFVVDERGEVTETVCARSPNQMLCDAAVRAIESSRFRPGMHRGRPVKVRFTVPIRFALTGGEGERVSPLTFFYALLGEQWDAAMAQHQVGPPRSGSVKGGDGTLAYDGAESGADRVVVLISNGVVRRLEATFQGEEGRRSIGDALRGYIEAYGPPADGGSFSPEQLGEPRRITILPEAGTLTIAFVPEAVGLGTEAEAADEIIEDVELDFDNLVPSPGPEIFEVVEEDPVLIGGEAWLEERARPFHGLVRSPATVWVQAVVTETGGVTDAVCIRTPQPGLCAPALRIVRTARFEPGRQRGRVVRVRTTLPIRFAP